MELLHESANFDIEVFLGCCDRMSNKFLERTKPIANYIAEGIIHSDGLCICALAEMFEVDYLIESGRANGASTEMLARYFVDHQKLKHIWSVDLKINPVFASLARYLLPKRGWDHIHPADRRQTKNVEQRLAPFRNRVSLVDGDAFVEIPRILGGLDMRASRVGIFLDGPKEEPQMRLANQLLDLSPNIAFVALDDVGPRYQGRFDRLLKNPRAVFCTSDDDFYQRYGWVNQGRLPFGSVERGSAMSGVGVLVNSAPPR